jgi:hypothetical protein
MIPSRQASDNYPATNFSQYYQSGPHTVGSCGGCHYTSKGGYPSGVTDGGQEFLNEHGGTNSRKTACNICHTSIPSMDTAKWPHGFQWKNR